MSLRFAGRTKVAYAGLICALVILAVFLAGCAAAPIESFKPSKVTPESYTPEPNWNPNTDPFLIRVSSLRRTTATQGGGAGTTTTVTLAPGTATPAPVPSPTPTPTPRAPSTSDPIWGIVYDRIEGGPIASATVTLYNSRAVPIATFTTNSSGMYSFVGVGAGAYQVKATASGYTAIPLSTRDVFYSGIPTQVDLEMGYAAPFQQIEGGRANAGATATLGLVYVVSTQQSYFAALFGSDGTVAQYTFTIADPDIYTIDSLKLTLPSMYERTDPAPAPPDPNFWTSWTAGTTAVVTHADASPVYRDSSTWYPNPSKVASDGTLTINLTRNSASLDLLLTYARLDYDYHHKSRP